MRPSPHDWFTEPVTRVEVRVDDEVARGGLRGDDGARCGHGDVTVTARLVGWRKVRFHTHENLGHGELEGAPIDTQTCAFWLVVDEALVDHLASSLDELGAPTGRARVLDALRGLGVALRTTTSLALMCSPRDLDVTLGGCDDEAELPARGEGAGPGLSPTVFLFDAAPGGVGLAERVFERRDELVARACAAVHSCPCAHGCPSCVAPGEGDGRKAIVLSLFDALGVHAMT